MRPEQALLLDACRVAPDSRARTAPAPADPATDWPRLLADAERHRVSPILTRHLSRLPAGVPADVLATLRARFDANSLRNTVLARDLAELLQRLSEHGVDAMPIKGPVLAISAYGDLALREFGDLDIVVRTSDFHQARALLGGWGFRPSTPLSAAGERTLLASDHHLALSSPGDRITVELHWSLDNLRPGRRLDGDWVWSNARRVALLGSEVAALSWSALLVYLCVHGAKHGWSSLGWIRDVAGVLGAAPPGELHAAASIAAEASAERRLALGALLAHELLGAPLPAGLVLRTDAAVPALVRDVRARLFADEPMGHARSMAFQCRTLDRARDRVGFCMHLVASPHVADVEELRLPSGLRLLYYVLRPLRLIAKRAGARSRSR